MQPQRTCPICGSALLVDAPEGQCPVCLLGVATSDRDENQDTVVATDKQASRQFGDYVLGRQLGSGGMGIVYEARQISLNRKVALKLVRDSLVASPTMLRRFMIEAEAAARLDHPNIVPLYEVGEFNGQPFFSMGLVEGESLRDLIARGDFAPKHRDGKMTRALWRERQKSLAGLMVKLAGAVHHAHQRGVIHRDLKPANVLIDQAGNPHLTDFGLAKFLSQQTLEDAQTLTSPDDILGTVNYMSPEQALGTKSTQAADIHGLGAVMYVLLTGRPPFTGTTWQETIGRVSQQVPHRPQILNPLVHKDLDTICLKCLEKDPLHRYASAEALAEDLERWLAGHPILARPAGPVRRTKQWIKRNPIGTALIGSLCLALSISLALLDQVKKGQKRVLVQNDILAAEAMDELDNIWGQPLVKTVTIQAKRLKALYGLPMMGKPPQFELSFGVRTGMEPSTTAHKYAEFLWALEKEMERELDEPVAFNLQMFKMGIRAEEMLGVGRADFMVVSATDYLVASSMTPLACKKNSACTIFAHPDSGIGRDRLEQLAGKSIAFPDSGAPMTVHAKARLVDAGVLKTNLSKFTNFNDKEPDWRKLTDHVDKQTKDSRAVEGLRETLLRVFKREFDAGVTSHKFFKSSPYSKLVEIKTFPVLGDIYVTRFPVSNIAVLRNVVKPRTQEERLAVAFCNVVIKKLDALPVKDESLSEVREALEKARRFDGESALESQGAGSADGPR